MEQFNIEAIVKEIEEQGKYNSKALEYGAMDEFEGLVGLEDLDTYLASLDEEEED